MTEAAERRFQRLRPEKRAEGALLRLRGAKTTGPSNGGEPKLAIHLSEPEEGDNPVMHEGEPLLYVPRRVSADSDGCIVDLMETPGAGTDTCR